MRNKNFYNIVVALFLSLLAVVGGYGMFEYKVRSDLREHYEANATPIFFRNEPLNLGVRLSPMEKYFGWDKTRKNSDVGPLKINTNIDTLFVDRDGKVVFYASASTNNVGLLSDKSYTIERSASTPEHRIVMLGDSMTGGTTANRHWVDLVEDILNDPEIHPQLGTDKIVKIYNVGIPGAGFPSFWRLYDQVGRKFDPDTVILNYIRSDFPRTNTSAAMGQLRDIDRMLAQAVEHVDKLKNEDVRFIVTVMPLYQDMHPDIYPYTLSKRLKELTDINEFYFMREQLPWQQWDKESLKSWYNLPWDGHMSVRGGTIYAREMARLIAEREFGVELVFPGVLAVEQERFDLYESVLGLYGAEELKVGGWTFKIKDMQALRNAITQEYIKGKELNWELYGIKKLLGEDILYTNIPPNAELERAFHELDLGTIPAQKGFLQMTCIKGDRKGYKLSSPSCYHGYIIYVGNADDDISELAVN
ncbi:MAG: SGNH/GDSL hydrolase family protein [Rhodospirillales bacterium]|nr:SGNH/GDSL hydrolase family protein [Rhodospirillales bacterium]MBO6786025.1 SGNH/GDSL hydrolase family protein [Rhodospirillales bacterium]